MGSISRVAAAGGPLSGWYVIQDTGPPLFIESNDHCIIRLDMPFEPSGDWLADAVWERHANGRMKFFARWHDAVCCPAFQGAVPRFKNGDPMYYLADIDHGTSRVHGEGLLRVSRAQVKRQPDGRWNFYHGG